MKRETLTLVLVYLAGIMERADESLLPGVYKEVGEALHVDPTALGTLTLFRSIVQTCCYPLAAYLSSRRNRAHVIALGAFLWATATFLVAISTTFFQVAVSRGLNGIGLAIVTPAIQSLVADSTEDSNRGMAFGWLGVTSNFGSILGNLCAILFASKSFNGLAGWRVAFLLVGFVSVIVGILVRLFASDPHYSDKSITTKHDKDKPFLSDVRELLQEAKMVIKIPPLAFAPLWLELIGFSHKTTAFLVTLFTISCSVGHLFGGYMGDTLAKKFPNAGRIILSQISSGSAIPLAAILLLGLPDDPSTAFSHGLALVTMGLFISWNGSATNGPIFAEIVPERARTSIYALDRSFESILASFAPPIVGMLAQNVYGYKPIPEGSSSVIKIETDRENAASLAKALYTAIGIPMVICCTIYSFLYCTYPRDRDRAKMQALIESEMQQLDEEEEEEEEKFGIEVKCFGDEEHDETYLLKQEQSESVR
ncbi:hypothetical protein Bca52824_021465 [Brassica carinata]|uniref:Major facilitator superfamily (MFS) profile domain-containing protein n=1 Tax=Brassica carinata TaxID=52824 RepID=A0A8X8ARZ4_BRACI|nr:hypothetical protein Bca52824_021465 [Brassica carinata]